MFYKTTKNFTVNQKKKKKLTIFYNKILKILQ